MAATTDTSVALNRFGLGARPDDPPPGDARRWLTAQFERYEPRPAAIAALVGRGQAVADIVDYREQARLARLQAQAAAAVPMTSVPPMAPQPPADAPGMAMAPPANPRAALRKASRDQAREDYIAAVGARAQVALQTPAPFVERLVWFWSNHFAVSIDKGDVIGLAGTLENEAIRPHVLGRFGDMLAAVERHPAMLLFLDQAVSVGPNSVAGARGRGRVGLNENLARETLELHTLGVGSGYGQADVTELARALTGWTVSGLDRGQAAPAAAGEFAFVDRIHEPGARTILGKGYGQTGEAQAQAVLDDLSVHPATATHIATKLARHFVSDDPPPALVARLQRAFVKSGGDLPTVYRALIASPEAWAPKSNKFKTPWEWTISAMRALGQTTAQAPGVNGLLNQLGQPIWKPGSPAGYDDIAAGWAGPDAIMRRVEAAERLATRNAGQVDARALAPRLFPAALSPASATALARAESPGQALALLLVTPEFLRR